MGEISTSIADITIITTDNPRFENPDDIISDIVNGVNTNACYYVEPDRANAISLASILATEDDLIVLSGKGAENPQGI